MVGHSVDNLSGRLTDLEHAVQSQRTTPATVSSTSQVPIETISSVEQALTHEVEQLSDEWEKTLEGQRRLLESLESYEQRQKSMDKQLAGLRSFAMHVENRTNTVGRAPALSGHLGVGTSVRERRPSLEPTPGASSSSTRPPEPPSIPAPPVPSEPTPPSDAQPPNATHFSTVRSGEVKSAQELFELT